MAEQLPPEPKTPTVSGPPSNEKAKSDGPVFVITPSVTAVRKEYTVAQRSASMFHEAPRIGSKVLRRGTSLKLSEKQFQRMEKMLLHLHKAHAIDIKVVRPGCPDSQLERAPHFFSPMKKKSPVQPPAVLTDPKVDLTATQEVTIIPPVEAKKDGPDPSEITPVQPPPASVLTELSPKKKGKRGSSTDSDSSGKE
jgi:hypothetical protein